MIYLVALVVLMDRMLQHEERVTRLREAMDRKPTDT